MRDLLALLGICTTTRVPVRAWRRSSALNVLGQGRLPHQSPDERKQPPGVRDALEFVVSPILEVGTRSSHQVGNSP